MIGANMKYPWTVVHNPWIQRMDHGLKNKECQN